MTQSNNITNAHQPPRPSGTPPHLRRGIDYQYKLTHKMKHILLSLGLLTAITAAAQVPTPAPPQGRPILLMGGNLHVGNGTVVPNAAVAFDKGRITYAGAQNGFTQRKAGYEIIDVEGQEMYPGLILPNTTLGLTEVESIRATVDEQEVGTMNPNVRSLIAYNTDSDIIPTVRTNGVLLAQITPRGGMLSGQSSIVQLDAWNWQDAAVRADDGLHLNWPQMVFRLSPAEDEKAAEKRHQGPSGPTARAGSQCSRRPAAYRQLPASRTRKPAPLRSGGYFRRLQNLIYPRRLRQGNHRSV